MKKIFLLLFSIFILSLVNAQLTYQIDTEVNLTIVCLNDGYCSAASYCNINIENPNKEVIIQNENMTNYGTWHGYNITPTENGLYLVSGYCYDNEEYEEIDYYFESTLSGAEPRNAGINSILLIFFTGTLLGFIFLNRYTNYEQWYTSMLKKYETKNYFKMAVSILGYNMVKNAFVIYYLIGFIIMLLLVDMVYMFNISGVVDVVNGLMLVYAWSSVAIAISFLSYLQEFFMEMMEEIQNIDWGIK